VALSKSNEDQQKKKKVAKEYKQEWDGKNKNF
jgi:hypothetical protein